MAISPAPTQLIRLFASRQPWPWQLFASSLAVHAAGIALVGWATHGKPGTPISTPSERVTRAYAVRYLVLELQSTRPELPYEHRSPRPATFVAKVGPSANPPRGVSMVEPPPQSAPRPPILEAEPLAPGATVGLGQIVATPHSDSTGGRGLAGSRQGLDRLPELVGGTGSACPELRAAATKTKGQSAVAVAFVVDTNGRVDPATLQVIESPGQPRTDHRFLGRVYVVGASMQVNPGRSRPAADDSALIKEVASHVAGLVFRPALQSDRVIRSTVLVSCQTF
jgi:hypothetical protein